MGSFSWPRLPYLVHSSSRWWTWCRADAVQPAPTPCWWLAPLPPHLPRGHHWQSPQIYPGIETQSHYSEYTVQCIVECVTEQLRYWWAIWSHSIEGRVWSSATYSAVIVLPCAHDNYDWRKLRNRVLVDSNVGHSTHDGQNRHTGDHFSHLDTSNSVFLTTITDLQMAT